MGVLLPKSRQCSVHDVSGKTQFGPFKHRRLVTISQISCHPRLVAWGRMARKTGDHLKSLTARLLRKFRQVVYVFRISNVLRA